MKQAAAAPLVPQAEEIAELKRRVALLEAFLDTELRARQGLTTDDIRKAWHDNAARRSAGK